MPGDLLPALFALLAPVTLTAVAAGASPALLLAVGGAVTYTTNVIVAVDPAAIPGALIHLWSLAAEEQFYILWPLLLLVLLRAGGVRPVGRTLVVLLALAVAYRLQLLLRGASIERLYYAPDTHADALLVGCAFGCCLWRARLPAILSSARARGVIGGFALALVLAAAVFVVQLPRSWRTARCLSRRSSWSSPACSFFARPSAIRS